MVEIPCRPYGLIPATLTPMNKDFEVDYEQLEEYIKWLVSFKVGGLAVNVDTGEGPHLYREEKIKIVQVISRIVKGKVPIIAGLHARNTKEAIDSAKEVKEAGANGLLVFPHPAFVGDTSGEVIYKYHSVISENVGIPIVIFNLQPALGGIEYSPETLRKLSSIKNVVALKEASFDAKKFVEIARSLRNLPRKITLLTGNDNFVYESLVLGAEGGLLGFGTIAVKEQTEMFELVSKKRYAEAKEIWEKLLPLENVIFAHPVRNYRARLKEALVMMGILKTTYVRPPLMSISENERKKIHNVLKELQML